MEHMKRRQFITLLGSAAAIWPFAARAQQPAMPVIGFLGAGLRNARPYLMPKIRQGLDEAGLEEGRNVLVEYRFAEGHYDRLPGLADELLRRNVAVIVADGAGAAVAAKTATEKVPIVFMTGANPVSLGLVASLNRPGANLTGITMFTTEMIAKRLELLGELLPKEAAIALLTNPASPNSKLSEREAQAAAGTMGRVMQVIAASSEAELEAAFATLRHRQIAAIVVQADPFFDDHYELLVALVTRYAVPAIFEWRQFAEAGGLASYGPSLPDAYRQVAFYAGRIVKGSKPAELPVEQPSKFELVVNLKTAKVLGLSLPPSLLARADEVIE
jgi:putative ABC transport system substrate-binding protein